MALELPPLKAYQAGGIDRIDALLAYDPLVPVLGVGPCGCGKSRIMYELTERWLHREKRVGILAHRQMLVDQLAADFEASDTPYTIFAAGHKYDASQPVQIISAPTMFARCFKKGSKDLPDIDLLLVDEAHQQTGRSAQAILFGAFNDGTVSDGYIFRGTSVVGFTATPAMRTGLYGSLVDFGSYSLMRKEGMHQIVKVFSPDEIDVKGLRPNANGDLSSKDLDKIIRGNNAIYGSVFREYNRLNPGQLPMILFAPSVEASKWFALSFCNQDVPVAHLDGEIIGMPRLDRPAGGERLEWVLSNSENREELLRLHKAGVIKGISNRFVLREAVNMPWCYHAIFATVNAGLTTFLQAVGRLQRAWPEYTHKILQDHGGSYWRHGSPNEDREWRIGDTNISLGRARIEACKKGEKPEGIRCPKCHGWRVRGPICVHCGFAHAQSVRTIRMLSGRLKHQTGQVYKNVPDTDKVQALWTQTLWSSSKHKRSVSSAVAIFSNKAQAAGLKIDWDKLRNPPPMPSSPQWHDEVGTIWPWLIRKRKEKK
jgi:superfamily II DNA or RNA helicase